MKKILYIAIFSTLTICAFSQNWTDPVNVSNMSGLNQDPDFCIDNNGVIHCVWVFVYESNFSKIFYCRSFDDGLTWTTADDVSLNTEKRIHNPHIVCDSENNIYLTYDFDTGNYFETLIFYKKFDGITWSEPFVVSEDMPESHANKLVIDNNNRVYCVWFRILYNETTFYRYLENDVWSDIFIPYDNNDYFTFLNCSVDSSNNLHWIGAHHYEGQTAYDIKPVYFFYDYEDDLWSDFIEFGERYSWHGFDIDLDNEEMPHLVWQEYTNDSTPPNDGTFYSYYNGTNWAIPELIVEDPKNQQIIIDNYNNPNIFDSEKLEDGTMLVHYYKTSSIWQGYIIDDNDYNGNIKIDKRGNIIYLLYEKAISGKDYFYDIMFSKTYMINFYTEIPASINKLKIFPNPFHQNLTISFDLQNTERLSIKIYTIQGKLINTLMNENKSQGKYEIIWNGKDKNGKEVTSGLYLVRLQSGRIILTRSVEYLK